LFSQQLFFDFLENNTVRNILAPVILATWKAEIGESQFKDSCAKILVRCYLKKKKNRPGMVAHAVMPTMQKV
jgi:hypothetical protein